MLRALYGRLTIKNKIDYLIVGLKILYIIYTIPFLMFAAGLYVITLSFDENPFKENMGFVKTILLHFSAVFWSAILWIFKILIINRYITGTLGS
ncbi:UNVERIFIED_CONTAM: hypothetical protein Cloal_4322 [Acetivibrio alkalicellulosi]